MVNTQKIQPTDRQKCATCGEDYRLHCWVTIQGRRRKNFDADGCHIDGHLFIPTPDTPTDTRDEERAVLTELLRKLDEAPEQVRAFYGDSTIALLDRAREVLARREKEGKNK